MPSLSQLKAGIEDLHAEAGGVIYVTIVRYTDVVTLMIAAAAGDPTARRTIEALEKFIRDIGDAPAHEAVQCATCSRALRKTRFAIVSAWAHRDDPREAIGFGICSACAPDGSLPIIWKKAATFLKRIWPESKMIDPSRFHGGSRA